MELVYYDYYTPYKDVHEKSKTAEPLASSKTVSEELRMTVTDMQEIINSTIIDSSDCRSLRTFSNNIKAIYDDAIVVSDFAESYAAVEEAYNELKQECDALEQSDISLKDLCNSEPDKDSDKYWKTNYAIGIIPTGKTFLEDEFNSDYSEWEGKVIALKTDCEMLVQNIDKYLEYLDEVNKCEAKDGAINTTVPKPASVLDYLTYPHYGEDMPFGFLVSDEERQRILSENNIADQPYVDVYVRMVDINGVIFPVYSIVDNEEPLQSQADFALYINNCLEVESRIDTAVLDRIKNGGTEIIFLQTNRCDNGYLQNPDNFHSAAYCNSENRNVVLFYPGDPNWDYYTHTILHETGHAFDFTLRYESTDEIKCGITHLNAEEIMALPEDLRNSLFTFDDSGAPLTWEQIIRDEANFFDDNHSDYPCHMEFGSMKEAQDYYDNYCLNASNMSIVAKQDPNDPNKKVYALEFYYYNNGGQRDGQSGQGIYSSTDTSGSLYDVHNYMNGYHEYFADSFAAYYGTDGIVQPGDTQSRFEFLCPETYSAMDHLIQQEIQSYGGSN